MPLSQLSSQQTLAKPVNVNHTVICSPHELIAIATASHDIVIYRLNGQIAFTVRNPDDGEEEEDRCTLTRAEWSPDGRRIAVAWSNGLWRIHETEKGDSIFESRVSQQDTNDDVVIGFSWQQHATGTQNSRPLDDFPRHVALLDVSTVLPRLSALPSHGLRSGDNGTKFLHQAATDSIFSESSPGSDEFVEVLLVHVSSGLLQVMLNGTSHVGTVKAMPGLDAYQYTSHVRDASHILIGNKAMDVIKLPLDELDGAILHLTSHSTTQILALIQYIQRSVQCIGHDYNTGITLPARMINNISMTLSEKENSVLTLSSTLLHLALTGHYQDDLSEWLVDIVKDTGLKRWDTSISTMYSSIQTHLHTHLLPALDRLVIATSKLRGLARLHQGAAAFTPDEKLFDQVLMDTDVLRSAILRALDICICEWSQWRVFAKWLKMQIDIASADVKSKEAAEIEERECLGIDYTIVVQYIQTVLRDGSRLGPYSKNVDGELITCSKAIEQSAGSAVGSVTAWQGRLFSSTTRLDVELHAAKLYDTSMTSSSLKLLMETEYGTTKLCEYAFNWKDDRPDLRLLAEYDSRDAIDAKLYTNGSCFITLQDHANGGVQLILNNVSNDTTTVLHDFVEPFQPRRFLIGGRSGKEFCVLFGNHDRTWQVLDLQRNDPTVAA